MIQRIVVVLLIVLFVSGCKQDYVPKPRGYFRIDLPVKEYEIYKSNCPYEFESPVYASVEKDMDPNSEPYWLNIAFKEHKATIHLSYKEVNNNLDDLMEDARTFVYKHTIKADAITEQPYQNPVDKVYGIFYDIKGDAASGIQFYLTDSTKHYVRGALYFHTKPNKDSIAPVLNFIKEDITHLIETFNWKYSK